MTPPRRALGAETRSSLKKECEIGARDGSRASGEPFLRLFSHSQVRRSTVSATPVPAVAHTRPFTDATRVLSSVLTPLEKRTLLFLAHRMPRWVNSDHLTALALTAMLGAGLSYWLARVTPVGLVLVVICLAINWFGDSLDGTLARVRQQQRPRYGYYVDHVVDAFGIAFLIGGLALSGYMTPLVAFGLLVAYFMLSAEVYLATHSLGTFKMSYFKVGPTELRIILAIGTLMLYVRPIVTFFGRQVGLFDVGGMFAIGGLLFTFVVSAVSNTRALYRMEPMPVRTQEVQVFRNVGSPDFRTEKSL
jgi:phosphatidylglycerophosphate synthase